MSALRIESATCAGHFSQQWRGRKSRRSIRVQTLQGTNDPFSTERINVTERSAPIWREPNSEHGADIAVSRSAQNALLKTAYRFIDHRQHAATLDLVGGDLDSPGRHRQQLVHGRVDAALLPFVVVLVEAL